MKVKKILMVCLGNICRSPLAHGILQHLANQRGYDWQVESAGTGNWHVGSAPDHRSVAIAKQHDIDISQQRAQQFSTDHFDEYDLIFVMDRSNLKNVLSMARNGQDREKVQLFLEDEEVADPYYDD